ncbi:hypothetical protein [Ilumatobacter coccineus]|uniref:Uncharacterized protein n=1 Tax=Ilumatobacter coccineus (strain NBRC 103263 / KCTC 29153 / YM16-304) TaxID=1313172 RepID=A0A6C7ECJ5_ILUCY|nr:hypothetical protein [Ilumatobacter coccineus]BAN04043.1 hypothetical protein YM304_37290 [Ilumatobacter coccineus YM16-304]
MSELVELPLDLQIPLKRPRRTSDNESMEANSRTCRRSTRQQSMCDMGAPRPAANVSRGLRSTVGVGEA